MQLAYRHKILTCKNSPNLVFPSLKALTIEISPYTNCLLSLLSIQPQKVSLKPHKISDFRALFLGIISGFSNLSY